jgi:hypothetical protein
MDRKSKTITLSLFAIIVVFSVGSLILIACEKAEPLGEARTVPSSDGGAFSYKLIYVEGMPCIWFRESCGEGGCSGITCDWSRWEGPREIKELK